MPAYVINYAPSDWDRDYHKEGARSLLHPDLSPLSLDITLTPSTSPDWQPKATAAFHFLRANSSRRYSNTALMTVLNRAEKEYREEDPTAWVITVEAPYNYDPDTEVKSGGVLGTLVQLNDGTCRALLAVTEWARGKGVGSALLEMHKAIGGATCWVKASNRDAQRFLLKHGLTPMVINAHGAVRYGNVSWDEVDV